MTRYIIAALLIVLFQSLGAQCDFNINAVVTQHSEPCARDGIITVTLTGANVDNGNIHLEDAQYGIEPVVAGGNSIPQTANGGVIKQVPPGSYIVKVTAMCEIGKQYISKSSTGTVTVTGSYAPPNPVEVIHAGIIFPYKCDATGVIPVKVSGGRPPYKLTVTNGEFVKTFDIPNETNSFPLDGLPTGQYSLSLKDNCGYFPTTIKQPLGVKEEKFELGAPTNTLTCQSNGKIPVIISEGKPPFSISITSDNGYSSNTVANSTGTVDIDQLNEGNYTIVVKDACEGTGTFYQTIEKISGSASILQTTSNNACGDASGEIKIALTENAAPYNIKVTSSTFEDERNDIYEETVEFKELEEGEYSFEIIDVCGNVFNLSATIEKEEFKTEPGIVTAEVEDINGKGNATIRTTGSIPFDITEINYTPFPGSSCSNTYTLPITVNSSDITLTDMCAGHYEIKVEDGCGNTSTATFDIKPKPIKITPSFPAINGGNGTGGEWSFDCEPIGEIKIKIENGSGKYKLYYIKHPDDELEATPSTPYFIGDVDESGNPYTISELPPGEYSIRIEDAIFSADCENKINCEILDFEIKSIPVTIEEIEDAFEEFVYASATVDENCRSLRAKLNSNSNSNAYNNLYMFINGGLFDVKYKIIGTAYETVPDVLNVTDEGYINFDLPEPYTYKKMRDDIGSIEVEIIPKTAGAGVCDNIIDILYFDEVKSSISIENPSCEGFTIATTQYTDTRGVLCYPYALAVYDETGEPIMSGNVETHERTSFDEKFPFGKYKIVFKDNEGYQWDEEVEYTNWTSNIETDNLQAINKTCSTFDLTFDVNNICYPYEWRLLDENDGLIKTGTVSDETKPLIESLEYNTTHKIVVTSLVTQESTTSGYSLDNKKALLDYQISQYNEYCLPDTAMGYIKISRNGDALFGKDTKFELVSRPGESGEPLIYIATGDETVFYPFSSDVTVAEKLKLDEGLYRFEMTDICGFSDILEIDYKKYKVLNFGYEIEYRCDDAELKPSATVVLGDEPQNVYFRLSEYPEGTLPGSTYSVSAGNGIQLTVSGHYKLQVSIENHPVAENDNSLSCPMDTLVFDYDLNYSKVMFDKLDAYICDDENGYIEFLVKGGLGDIEYTLIEPEVGTISHITLPQGTPFTYENAKQEVVYEIEFRDTECEGAGGTEKITVNNFIKDRVIFGPEEVCLGEPVHLYSEAPAQSYQWTFPNGLGTSTLANPVIDNATPLHSGIYTLDITNIKGCRGSIKKDIKINVIETPPPAFDALIYHCISNDSETAKAEALPGHTLMWFDKDKTPLPEAPTYSKAAVDTFDYFVSQINTDMYCRSDTFPMQIIIEDFPDTVVYAYANDICRDEAPVVVIPDTCIYPGYVYRIYNAFGENTGEETAEETGEETAHPNTLRIQSSESMESSGTLYIEVETIHQCVSTERSKVPVRVVHPVPPTVYDTLYCLDETETLPLRADSTPENRLQWYGTDAVTRLSSAPVPLTNVAGEFSYWVAQVDTLLGCVGDKAELKVSISGLPDIDIGASAAEICRRTSPTVTVENTYALYTYTLFDKNGVPLDSEISNGTPVNLNSPGYILHQNETLYVEIQNQHKCTSRDRAVVPVSVVIPDVPQVFDTLYCLNAVAAPLRAIPGEGYYIQWYSLDVNPVNTAPVPPVNPVDTFYYNVTQKHNVLHCESDTVQIQVIIDALPDTVAANSPTICPGQYPVIKIPETKPEHIYNVYSESGALLASEEGSGDSINIALPYPIEISEDFFVETVNPNNCASGDRTKTRTEVINYMYLLPEKIPQYQREKLYSFQLESNAIAPYEYSTTDMLPSGFTLSIEGLISGTAPRNGFIDPVPFHVIVVDVNGCYAGRDYVLESGIFIPQVFTPNGDGKNDIFMKGRRLVIFDRLGLKIFEGDDGWDGRRFDGTPAPPDTYFYLIYYEDEDLMTQGRKKGYITLIRGN